MNHMSTEAEIRDELRTAMYDNASYDADGSVAKARLFVTACRRWLNRFGFDESQQGNSGTRMRMDGTNSGIRKDMEAAQRWIDGQAPTTPTTAYAGYVKVDLAGGRE